MKNKAKKKRYSPMTAELARVWRIITVALFFVGLLSWLFGSGDAFVALLPIVSASVLGGVMYAAFENRVM